MTKPIILLLAASLAMPVAAQANDTTAELATGGLVFVRNDDIEMRAEDLFISTQEIRVRYRFFNKADKDVTVKVAFPMPEITWDVDSNIAVPTQDPVNLLGFTTKVDGKPVQAEAEQRVFADGKEHTALLKQLGIPFAPHLKATDQALERLPHDRWAEFEKLKLIEIEEYTNRPNGPMQKHPAPRWTLRSTYHWTQTFPANKEITVEHRYKPSVGASVMTSLTSPLSGNEPWVQQYKTKYCLEKDILDRVDRARRAKGGDGNAPFAEERVDYILETGANWSGPIKDFRLVIDKGSANNLVSFCGDGVKKIGPTQFEMRKTDFKPTGNIAVLILKPLKTP